MNNLHTITPCSLLFPRYDPGMKESRLEQIGSAAAGIAHDLNNQLNLIVNYLADGARVDEAREAAQRCSALTNGLLTYCRTEALVNQSLDPAKIARKFVNEFTVPEGITLEVDIPHSLPLMRANLLAVTRAMFNLAKNACDAMNGNGTLRITATAQQIDIADSGPGICQDHLAKIFEPFFTTKKGDGFGLGLPIVRELMREMGGYVTACSEPGVGTNFTLRFRAA